MDEPSIKLEHSDSRGEIYSIQLPNDRELMLIHSTPGSFRGGHSHDCDEIVMVLSGELIYHKKGVHQVGEVHHVVAAGDTAFNHAGLIHMGEFLEDTWLIEYKLAKKEEWSQKNYEPYRKQVRESM